MYNIELKDFLLVPRTCFSPACLDQLLRWQPTQASSVTTVGHVKW